MHHQKLIKDGSLVGGGTFVQVLCCAWCHLSGSPVPLASLAWSLLFVTLCVSCLHLPPFLLLPIFTVQAVRAAPRVATTVTCHPHSPTGEGEGVTMTGVATQSWTGVRGWAGESRIFTGHKVMVIKRLLVMTHHSDGIKGLHCRSALQLSDMPN